MSPVEYMFQIHAVFCIEQFLAGFSLVVLSNSLVVLSLRLILN